MANLIDEVLQNESLTARQEEAVRELEKDLEIVACAGAGKTKTVTLRVINLIMSGVKPENIVAITFTRKAAEEMKERIYKAGEKYIGNTIGFAGMYIGTIDAFCLKMLQEYIEEYAKFSVLDDVQLKIFMERFSEGKEDFTGLKDSVIDGANNLKGGGKYQRKLDYYIGLMSILNNCYYDKRYRNNWSVDLVSRLNSYNKCLRDNYYFDYSSLIREMIERLDPDSDLNGGQMSDFARKIFDKVKYLIIDEYQDSNPPQEYLAGLFHKYGNTNLCVVGDADQTIYQFRGSDESNILGFKAKYNAKRINLNQDFRSTEAIVDIARKSIIKNHVNDTDYEEMVRGIVPGSTLFHEDGDAVYGIFDDYDQESDFITERIKELSQNGIPLSEIAVLFRDRRRIHYGMVLVDFQDMLAQKLKAAGIDYIVEGINNLSKTAEYKASKAIFEYINDQYFYIDKKGVKMDDSMLKEAWLEVGNEHDSLQLVKGIHEAIKELNSIEWSKIRFGHEYNMQKIFQDFIANMAFIESGDKEAEKILYNLGKFSKIIADYELLFFKEGAAYKAGRFITHLVRVADGLYPEGEQDNSYIRGDAVRLMTIHQSKGLEFAAVFLPGFTADVYTKTPFERGKNIYGPVDAIDDMSGGKGNLWIPNYEGYENKVEADRKLFYVAVTRSKKYLFLTYGVSYGEDKFGKAVRESSCIFFNEVKQSPYLKAYTPGHVYTQHFLPRMERELLPMTLNFSLLSDYFDCPYRFKLSNFYGFVQPYKSIQGYGRMLHEIMMHIHRAWIDGETLTDKRLEGIVDESFYLPFASEPEKKKAHQGAIDCAHAYVKQNKADADKIIASELDINIEMGEGVSVNGRIDLVRKMEEDGRESIAIVDLKSAGKDAEQCLSADQLKIYALGYQQMTGQDADFLMIYNLDFPDGSRNVGEKIDSRLVNDAKNRIMRAASSIRVADLPRKASGKCETCYNCDLCKKEVTNKNSRFLIESVKEGFDCGGHFGTAEDAYILSVQYKKDNNPSEWITLVSCEESVIFYHEYEDRFEKHRLFDFADDIEVGREIDKYEVEVFEGIDLVEGEGSCESDVYRSIYEQLHVSNKNKAVAPFMRFVIALQAREDEKLSDLRDLAIGKYIDEVEIPVCRYEQEFNESVKK